MPWWWDTKNHYCPQRCWRINKMYSMDWKMCEIDVMKWIFSYSIRDFGSDIHNSSSLVNEKLGIFYSNCKDGYIGDLISLLLSIAENSWAILSIDIASSFKLMCTCYVLLKRLSYSEYVSWFVQVSKLLTTLVKWTVGKKIMR